MILLGPPEWPGLRDFGDDGATQSAARVERGLRLFGRRLLVRRMKEDGRTILRAHVRPLAIELRRVVTLPEYVKQLFVADFRRVVFDFDDLRVAGGIGA